MAMNGDALGLAVAQTLIRKSAIPPTAEMEANIRQFWKDVCNDIVGHITSNAEVPAGIGVQAGPYPGATTNPGSVL